MAESVYDNEFFTDYGRELAQDTRKFHRTIITVEVLSEDPLDEDMNLRDVGNLIWEGHASGVYEITEHQILGPKTIAAKLIGQHSDPNFLLMYD